MSGLSNKICLKLGAVVMILAFCLAAKPDDGSMPTSQDLKTEVITALERAQTQALGQLKGGDHWNMPLWLGANWVSQYYLLHFWLAHNPESEAALLPNHFNEATFKKILLDSQLDDGSWMQTPEANLNHGNLEATIMNYWALKVMGVDPGTDPLMRARRFILAGGGLEAAPTFARVVCALFGQLSWSRVPWAPLFFVNPNNPEFINVELFPQWIRPHILPIAYLRTMRVRRDLGPRFSIAELHAPGKTAPRLSADHKRGENLRWVIDLMLDKQARLGSWGGYTAATLLTLLSLDDYESQTHDVKEADRIQRAETQGLHFTDTLYLSAQNPAAYLGTVCDGRYWDTILIMQGLTRVNPALPALSPVVRYLKNAQVKNGGIPFGLDFETTPDIDDTSELITTLLSVQAASSTQVTDAKVPPPTGDEVQRALDWLASMQNSDGGWGAFDKNNTGNFIVRDMAAGLKDAVTLFDPSTPDVTGHALEALGASGATVDNSLVVRRAVQFLRRKALMPQGIWSGRWGVNYIYGTNAAVSGLLRVHVPVSDPLIQQALTWFKAHQNQDGGFGETTRSDLDKSLAGIGASTPSQTAWALMALVRGGQAQSSTARAAAIYLLRNQKADGAWTDPSVVGTGHSGIVYLVYPSYPLAFPMIALGEFLRVTQIH